MDAILNYGVDVVLPFSKRIPDADKQSAITNLKQAVKVGERQKYVTFIQPFPDYSPYKIHLLASNTSWPGNIKISREMRDGEEYFWFGWFRRVMELQRQTNWLIISIVWVLASWRR